MASWKKLGLSVMAAAVLALGGCGAGSSPNNGDMNHKMQDGANKQGNMQSDKSMKKDDNMDKSDSMNKDDMNSKGDMNKKNGS